jgi:tetratricopeptide (TPR) repeat protein
MADAYVNMTNFDYDGSSDALPRAFAAARRAVELDTTHAQVYASLGFVLESQLKLAPAESAFQNAIALDWRYLWAHHYYSLLLAMMGRAREAQTQIELAIALDPLSTQARTHLGVVLGMQGRFDQAVKEFEQASAITPSFALVRYYSGALAAAQGRFADAIPALENARRFAAGFPGVLAALAYSYRKVGRAAAADSVQSELRAQRTTPRGRINAALGEAVLGDVDGAFRELSDVQWDMPTVIDLRADPLLARLRADRRYPALLSSLGLPQ